MRQVDKSRKDCSNCKWGLRYGDNYFCELDGVAVGLRENCRNFEEVKAGKSNG